MVSSKTRAVTGRETENVIAVKDLSFRYKAQKEGKALDKINLDIEQGQFVVIMGSSGAGKSTLANCLNGLIPNFMRGQYEGSIAVLGKNPAKEKVGTMSKEIGLVFQDFESQLFSTNTKLEIVFGPENFNVPRAEMQRILERIIEVVKLQGLENRQPATLSGGQKQRLAIGSVLAIQPKIVCMDEPTTDLDPLGKLGIFQIAKELHQDKDLTLLIIEHETEEALQADRIIIMDHGKIVRDGRPPEVLREIEFFDSIGIMPLQVPNYFHRLNLPRQELPLEPQAGLAKFRELQLAVDERNYQELLKKDEARETQYGDVIIAVKGVEHTYANGNMALKGVDLEIRAGEFIAILGHNGSGKTTLVKHFNGLLQPTKGAILVNGKDTRKSSIFEIGKVVGYVFQNPDHQIFSDTVYEEVAFSPKLRGCSKEEVEQRVKEALQAVDMEGFEQEDPFSLTKGERQRIAVASVLSAQPQVIILDEPTTGLDYKEQRQMMELVKKLNEKGHTIIIVTHTMWVVAEYAHRVAVIKDGLLAMYGRTRDVFKNEEDLAQSYLKTPHIVTLSNLLGKTVLSLDELLFCTAGSQRGEVN